jgi:enamine deaminase RidA (YjgF/YER057c/UK114 family)
MPKREIANPDVYVAPGGYFSNAVEAQGGRTVFLAGQLGRDEKGETVPGDFVAQLHLAVRNIQKLLATAGGTLDDVVKITVFVTDPRYTSVCRDAFREYVSVPYPASTFIVVAGLARPEYLIEIEAIAYLS